MEKLTFDVDDKIVTIIDGELRKGIVTNIYPLNPPIIVVKFEDGTFEKIPYHNVAPEPKAEITIGNALTGTEEITITSDEFKTTAINVIVEETKNCPILGTMFASLIGKLYEALFTEPWEND